MNSLIRKSLQKMRPYSSARDEFSASATIFLDANENPMGIYNRYPDPYQRNLRKAIATSWNVSSDAVFIGNGSDEVIDLVYRLFCEPGKDKALLFTPTYGMYAVSAGINNVEIVNCPLNQQFEIDLYAAQKQLKDPSVKVAFVCSPNNPTGNSTSWKIIEGLLTSFEGILVVDEAYIDFSDHPSLVQLVAQWPRLIVVRTLSKAWGLAGARIGIGCMHPELRQWFDRIKPPYNVSSLNAAAALKNFSRKDVFASNLNLLLSERTRVQNALINITGISKIYPSDTNFLLLACQKADLLYQFLISEGIVVRNRSQQIRDCLRITIGTHEENTQLITSISLFYTQKST